MKRGKILIKNTECDILYQTVPITDEITLSFEIIDNIRSNHWEWHISYSYKDYSFTLLYDENKKSFNDALSDMSYYYNHKNFARMFNHSLGKDISHLEERRNKSAVWFNEEINKMLKRRHAT